MHVPGCPLRVSAQAPAPRIKAQRRQGPGHPDSRDSAPACPSAALGRRGVATRRRRADACRHVRGRPGSPPWPCHTRLRADAWQSAAAAARGPDAAKKEMQARARPAGSTSLPPRRQGGDTGRLKQAACVWVCLVTACTCSYCGEQVRGSGVSCCQRILLAAGEGPAGAHAEGPPLWRRPCRVCVAASFEDRIPPWPVSSRTTIAAVST